LWILSNLEEIETHSIHEALNGDFGYIWESLLKLCSRRFFENCSLRKTAPALIQFLEIGGQTARKWRIQICKPAWTLDPKFGEFWIYPEKTAVLRLDLKIDPHEH